MIVALKVQSTINVFPIFTQKFEEVTFKNMFYLILHSFKSEARMLK